MNTFDKIVILCQSVSVVYINFITELRKLKYITKGRIVKTDLKGALLNYTLGFYNYSFKTLQLWTSELSRKSRYQLSYSQLESSSGPMPVSQMQLTQQPLAQKQHFTVSQDSQAILNVSKEEKAQRPAKNFYKNLNGLGISFSQAINIKRSKLRIFNGLYTFWENKRLRWGMILLMIVAPLIKFAYLPFPIEGFGDYFVNSQYIQIPNTIEGADTGWYWGLVRMYIWSNGELLAPVISIVGIFFLFPRNYYPSYLIGIPFGYYAGLSIYRLFFVGSYDTFHESFSVPVTLMFLVFGVVAFIISDKILFQQNHVKRAHEARIIGLINMPGMEWEDKEQLIKKETKELMKHNNELFIKETA